MVLTAVPFSMVSVSAAEATNISMSGMTYPSGTLNKGDLFVLRGTISANKTIQRIEIGIVKDGKWVAGHKVDQTVNAKSFNVLQKADSKIKFGDLAEGNYSYRCWVWIDGKSNKMFDKQFTVAAEAAKITLSGVSYPSGTLNKGDLFVLKGTISANKNIQRIEIGIVKDGKWVAGHTQKYHYGIDIGASGGSAVKAAAPGTVICAGLYQGYGYCVQVKHSDGKVTLYGHMRNSLRVKKGATVSRGQVLGYVGGTGYGGKKVYAEHLHFGIYKSVSALSREYGSTASAVSYNPLNYLP